MASAIRESDLDFQYLTLSSYCFRRCARYVSICALRAGRFRRSRLRTSLWRTQIEHRVCCDRCLMNNTSLKLSSHTSGDETQQNRDTKLKFHSACSFQRKVEHAATGWVTDHLILPGGANLADTSHDVIGLIRSPHPWHVKSAPNHTKIATWKPVLDAGCRPKFGCLPTLYSQGTRVKTFRPIFNDGFSVRQSSR